MLAWIAGAGHSGCHDATGQPFPAPYVSSRTTAFPVRAGYSCGEKHHNRYWKKKIDEIKVLINTTNITKNRGNVS